MELVTCQCAQTLSKQRPGILLTLLEKRTTCHIGMSELTLRVERFYQGQQLMTASSNSPNFALSISSQENNKRLSEKKKKKKVLQDQNFHYARRCHSHCGTHKHHHAMLQDWMTLGNANTPFSKARFFIHAHLMNSMF